MTHRLKTVPLLLLGLSCALSATGAQRVVGGCHGQTLTVSNLAGKVNASTRICMKMVKFQDGSPASVTFWKVGTLGQIEDLGTKVGSACFDYSVSVIGKVDLRAGEFSGTTKIYISEIDATRGLDPVFHDHAVMLAAINPPQDPYTVAGDFCKPECERLPSPKPKPGRYEACVWHCSNSGKWAQSCSNDGGPDPKAPHVRLPTN